MCNNALTVSAEVLENAMLREVEGVVLDPVVIQAALDRAVECIVGDGGEQWQAELRQTIDRVDAELARLVDAVVQGRDSHTLTAEIQKREARKQELHAEMKEILDREFVAWRSRPNVRDDLEHRIQDWRGLLRRRAVQGRQILRKLIDGRLLLTPHTDQTSAYYEFAGIGTLTGLLSGIVPHKVASPRGIARMWTPKLKGKAEVAA